MVLNHSDYIIMTLTSTGAAAVASITCILYFFFLDLSITEYSGMSAAATAAAGDLMMLACSSCNQQTWELIILQEAGYGFTW